MWMFGVGHRASPERKHLGFGDDASLGTLRTVAHLGDQSTRQSLNSTQRSQPVLGANCGLILRGRNTHEVARPPDQNSACSPNPPWEVA
eukprot:5520621-Alexandrium_andersonii.AAC.2